MYTTPIPLGYQAIAPGDTTTVFGLTVPTGPNGLRPNRAFLLGEAGNQRYRDDGVDPTASVGMFLAANVQTPYDGDLNAVRFCNTLVAGGVLHVLYYYVSGSPAQYPLKPAGYQQLATGTVGPAYGLTLPPGIPPRVAWIQVTGATVRIRDDGGDPTTTTGMFFNSFMVYEGDLTKIRFSNATTATALNITYYV